MLSARRVERAIAGLRAMRGSKRRNTGGGQVRPLTLELTVHDAFGGYLVCGGLSFYPHARSGAEGVPTSSLGLHVQGCQCTTLSPQFLLLASKTARRSATAAARCALRHRPAPVFRSHPGVAPWLPHEGPANGEGGRGHETCATRRGLAPGVPTR